VVLAIKELKGTGYFEWMSHSQDEDEHSIEMHLPYVRKVFQGYSEFFLKNIDPYDDSANIAGKISELSLFSLVH